LHTRESADMPVQEKGIRPSNALPYEMYAEGRLNPAKDAFEISFESRKNIFGENTAGAPFTVYARYKDDAKVRSYAVLPADTVKDAWALADFENSNYQLEVHGPNGFFRSFRGDKLDGAIDIACHYQAVGKGKNFFGNIEINIQNKDVETCILEITNNYTKAVQTKELDAHTNITLAFDLGKTFGWYDVSLKLKGNNAFEKRYAGKVEIGKESFTDPLMGRVI